MRNGSSSLRKNKKKNKNLLHIQELIYIIKNVLKKVR